MGSAFLEDPGMDEFEGLDLSALGVDQAYLTLSSDWPSDLTLYTRSHDCHGCPLKQHELVLPPGGHNNTVLHTSHPWTLVLAEANTSLLNADHKGVCGVDGARLGEFGVYELAVFDGNCTFSTRKEPVFEYGALVIAVAVYAGLALLYAMAANLFSRITKIMSKAESGEASSQTVLNMAGSGDTTAKPASKPRIKSLDTFRGLSIVIMIFVNYGAGSYWFLEHATWHGLQVADLVFPWFMWIMGVCIPMGLRSALRRNTPRGTILWRIVKRSLKLFVLGVVLNSLGGWVFLDKYRVPGVLQRFAVCYLVTSAVALFTTPREPRSYESDLGTALADVIQLWPQWFIHLLIVVAHTLITFLLPVPGCPVGYQGPGGIALLDDEGQPRPHCVGGAAGEVDRWILTSSHLYQNPTAKHVYSSAAFDPEGILGSLTSIFQVFLGLQAGMVLQCHKEHSARLWRWLAWAALLGAVGAGLCGASMDQGVIPVNKNLWSLSFVLVTSCFAYFLLALCYLMVDVWGIWDGSPLYQAGMNSIFLYVGHNVAYNLFPWHYSIGTFNTHLEYLAECLWGTTLWVLIALYLHHKGKFYTV